MGPRSPVQGSKSSQEALDDWVLWHVNALESPHLAPVNTPAFKHHGRSGQPKPISRTEATPKRTEGTQPHRGELLPATTTPTTHREILSCAAFLTSHTLSKWLLGCSSSAGSISAHNIDNRRPAACNFALASPCAELSHAFIAAGWTWDPFDITRAP